jgi:serine/threonine protein kinase/tetratricopeptide (TPR) repeat protein
LRAVFAPGRNLQDRYILERELGRGAMGQVYLGRDTRLGRPVAIKVILPPERDRHDFHTENCLRQRFADEARLGASLTHAAIATVFDYGFHEGHPFTVFEYIPGETLRDLLKRRGRLPLDEVQLTVGPLAQALDFAHGRRIVHRDLKPENVRATEQGQFKVLDLGLARDYLREGGWSGFAGTPAYAAPEQAAGLPCDGRADQYALALIAYELLTGRRPFEGRDWRELLAKHTHEHPPEPQSFVSELPDSVCAGLMRALQKDPDFRFTTCTEFAVALGCQPLAEPTPSPEVLLEAQVSRMGGEFRSYHFPFTLSEVSPPVHLALSSEALWGRYRDDTLRWPVASMESVHSRGRVLVLRLHRGGRTTRQWFRMNDRHECRAWCARLKALLPNGAGTSRDGNGARTRTDSAPLPGAPVAGRIVLLKRKPAVRLQLLGALEAAAATAYLAREGLAIRAAMMGSDAVVGLDTERLPGYFRSSYRATGMAARTVDRQGRLELLARRFDVEIRGASISMVVIAALEFLCTTAFVVGDMSPGHPLGAVLMWCVLLRLPGAWLLGLTFALGLLRWPQLARPVGLCFLSQAAALVIAPLAIALAAVATGRMLGGGTVLGLSLMVAFGFGSLLAFLGRRLFAAYESYRRYAVTEVEDVAPIRRRTGRLALAGSLAYAAWIFGLVVWLGVRAVGEFDLKIESLRVSRRNDFSSEDDLRARVKYWEREVASDAHSEWKLHYLASFRLGLAYHLIATPPRDPRRLREALALARSAGTAFPDRPDTQSQFGDVCSRAGDHETAAAALARAMALRPFGRGYPVDWARMAAVQARKGDRAEARRWLKLAETAVRSIPNPDVATLIAEVREQLERPEGVSPTPGAAAR